MERWFFPRPKLVAVSLHSSAPSKYMLPGFRLLVLAKYWVWGGFLMVM